MSAVWKYRLEVADRQIVLMLRGAEILHVDCQGADLCMWARVDDSLAADDTEARTIVVAGTGHPLVTEAWLVHLGSALMAEGSLVWHVFEERPAIEGMLRAFR